MTDQRRTPDDLPIDLSALDPTTDPVRYGRVLRAVTARAQAELAHRRAHHSPLVQMRQWRRHTIAAAITIAAASIVALARMQPSAPSTSTQPGDRGPLAQIAVAMGLPNAIARSVDRQTSPAVAELLYAMESTR